MLQSKNLSLMFLFISIFIYVSCNSKEKNIHLLLNKINAKITFENLFAFEELNEKFIKKRSLTIPKDIELKNKPVIKFDDSTNMAILVTADKKILIFDKNGQLATSIDNYGKGPNQYDDISRLYLYDNYIYVLSYYKNMIQKYNSSGKFVNSYDLKELRSKFQLTNFFFENVILNKDKLLIFAKDVISDKKYFNIIETDTSFSYINKKIIDYPFLSYYPMSDIAVSNDKYYFALPGSEYIFQITKEFDTIAPYVKLNFQNDKNILKKLIEIDLNNPAESELFFKHQNEVEIINQVATFQDFFFVTTSKRFYFFNANLNKGYILNFADIKDDKYFNKLMKSSSDFYYKECRGIELKYKVDLNKNIFVEKIAIYEPDLHLFANQ